MKTIDLVLAISVALNVVSAIGILFLYLRTRQMNRYISSILSDLTHESIGWVSRLLRSTIMVCRTQKGNWRARSKDLTAEGETPVAAAINLLENLLRENQANDSEIAN